MSTKTSDGYDYDSYDRFGDDLCELLLSYLLVRDKIRFESVSKQWKRLVYNKQQSLIISYSDLPQESYTTVFMPHTDVWYAKNRVKISSSVFEILFKKFKFINELELVHYDISDELLQVITNNCLYLKKITFETYNLSGNCLKNFGLKCGQNLKYLMINKLSDKDLQLLVKLTPNVETVFVRNYIKLFNEQYLPKLESIKVSLNEDINDLKEFTDKYHKQIKRIKFRKDEISRSKINNAFEQFSRFENLVSLSIFVPHFLTIDSLVNCLVHFKSLQILDLEQKSEDWNFVYEDKYFEGFKSLKLLGIKQLSILSAKISDEILKELSQMKNLLKLHITSFVITNSGVCHLIKSSPQLNTIQLQNKYINETTIESFIEKANLNPKIQYNFIITDFSCLTVSERNTNKYIPKNLLIRKKL